MGAKICCSNVATSAHVVPGSYPIGSTNEATNHSSRSVNDPPSGNISCIMEGLSVFFTGGG
jgi:hypothetical protein